MQLNFGRERLDFLANPFYTKRFAYLSAAAAVNEDPLGSTTQELLQICFAHM